MTSYLDDLISKYQKEKVNEAKKPETSQKDLDTSKQFEVYKKQETSENTSQENLKKPKQETQKISNEKPPEAQKTSEEKTSLTPEQTQKEVQEKPKPKEPEKPQETPKTQDKQSELLQKLKSFETKVEFEKKPKQTSLFDEQEETLEQGVLITSYKNVKIYRLKTQSLLHYSVPVPKPNPSQKLIINTLKEATTRLISTDPYKIKDSFQRKNIYYQKVLDILENAQEINIPKHLFPFYADAVVKEMTGYGIIEPLLEDDKLEEIMVVGPKKPVYVYHVDYGMMTTNIIFFSDEGIADIIDKIARSLGRNVDIANPLLDARLPDGSRVNATVPPASIDGPTLTIRKFREDPYTIVDLINFKTVNLETAAFLWCVVEGFGAKPANILISGGTGSGKTTTLNVFANFIPESERTLTIEDTAELKLPVRHVIRFEGKPPGLEGKGELSLDILTKNTLRMRPDRIIVGEIRHKEASTLFTAMNTGHDGCMGTVHANSAKETIVRLTSPPMNVPPLMLAGIDFIIIQKRLRTAKGQVRRITAIAEIKGVLEGTPKINTIFIWNPETDSLERTKEPIYYFDLVKSYTSLSDEQILEKLQHRADVLKNLINKNIRSISEVSKEIQKEYILKR